MRTTPLLALLVATALLTPFSTAEAYEDLGLRLRWEDPALADCMDIHQRLRRIDDIEQSGVWKRAPSDSMRLELVRLYRGSPLMKHRRRALELVEGLPPEVRAEELGLSYSRTYNPWEARENFEAWVALDSTRAEPVVREALFLFEGALGTWDEEKLAEATERFHEAVSREDAGVRAWRGLAAALVAQQRYEELRPVAARLRELDDGSPGIFLFSALAHEAAGMEHHARRDFEAAFERMGPVTRERYEIPGGRVVTAGRGPDFADVLERPEPLPLRGWWSRLTEAEVLFAQPDDGVHGWDTPAGEAYVLYGRPSVAEVGEPGSISALLHGTELTRFRGRVAQQVEAMGPSANSIWVWLVPLPSGRSATLVFERISPFARWSPTETLTLERQRKAGAIRMAESVPTVAPRPDRPAVDMVCRGFPAPNAQWRVETWVSTRSRGGVPPREVRLRLQDGEGRPVDEVRLPCSSDFDRAELRRHLPELPADQEGWIHGFGAQVPAGELLVTVDVLGESDEVLASGDAQVDFRRRARADVLGMSELLLCDVYREGLWQLPIDASFQRHGMVVVPRPEMVLAVGQEDMPVYYEVFGAATDESGLTRLDVEYTVYAAEDFDPYTRGPGYRDGKLAEPRLRLVFPDERTGRTRSGTVIKGTRISLEELEPGGYFLRARVTDRLARRESQRTLSFVVEAAAAD